MEITPRLIDLVIVKNATSPTPLNGIVTYDLTVTNKGPDTATNVQVADPAPSGISYLTANPSQGTCSVTPALVTCSLGSIAAGQTVTIRITARATTVGRHVNTATVVGGGGRETNPADNTDDAETIVPAPLTPPTAKPKPAPELCRTLAVGPKLLRANGKAQTVTIRVVEGSKPAKGVSIRITGPGINRTVTTNAKGVVRVTLRPARAGILRFTITNAKACNAQRVGVVGVFEPPVTG